MDNGQWIYHSYLIRFSLQTCVFISHTINQRYRGGASCYITSHVHPKSCYFFACKKRKQPRNSKYWETAQNMANHIHDKGRPPRITKYQGMKMRSPLIDD